MSVRQFKNGTKLPPPAGGYNRPGPTQRARITSLEGRVVRHGVPEIILSSLPKCVSIPLHTPIHVNLHIRIPRAVCC